MADQKSNQDAAPTELDDQQLEKAQGGLTAQIDGVVAGKTKKRPSGITLNNTGEVVAAPGDPT